MDADALPSPAGQSQSLDNGLTFVCVLLYSFQIVCLCWSATLLTFHPLRQSLMWRTNQTRQFGSVSAVTKEPLHFGPVSGWAKPNCIGRNLVRPCPPLSAGSASCGRLAAAQAQRSSALTRAQKEKIGKRRRMKVLHAGGRGGWRACCHLQVATCQAPSSSSCSLLSNPSHI